MATLYFDNATEDGLWATLGNCGSLYTIGSFERGTIGINGSSLLGML